MMIPTIESVEPGLAARLHLTAARAVAAFFRTTGLGGLGRSIEKLAVLFGRDNHVIFGLPQGGRLKVGLHDAYWLAPLLRTGTYEPEVAFVLDRVLDQSSAVIDCGANIGYWSVYAAQRIPDPHRILAIEPSPFIFPLLQENARLNEGAFTCIQAAAWNEEATSIALSADPLRHSWSSAAAGMQEELHSVGFEVIQVPTTTIDEAAASHFGPEPELVVVKIDVEGAEMNVLDGASRTLQGGPLIVYEEHGRDPAAELTERLIEVWEMTVYSMEGGSHLHRIENASRLRDLKREKHRAYNLFAARPGTIAHQRLAGFIRGASS